MNLAQAIMQANASRPNTPKPDRYTAQRYRQYDAALEETYKALDGKMSAIELGKKMGINKTTARIRLTFLLEEGRVMKRRIGRSDYYERIVK